jgi:hypothetical protein
MPAKSADITLPKPTARSRVTNGSDLLPNVDGRSLIARRYRDLVAALCADQGGLGVMAEARLQLVRRFAALAVLAESAEARLARGEPFDLSEYTNLTSTLVRVAARLGINRVPKNVTPDLQAYINAKSQEARP